MNERKKEERKMQRGLWFLVCGFRSERKNDKIKEVDFILEVVK